MMDANLFQIVVVLALLGFMWTLHRDVSNLRKEVGKDISEVRKDMAGLRERMVRVESLLEGFVGRPPGPQT